MYEAPSDRPTEVGSRLSEISRAVVQIHAQYYGRGPERARTIWHRDVIVCLLEDVYTPAERTLIQAGHFEQVRNVRSAFEDEVEPLLRGAVEGITDRQVRAFVSQVSREPELAAEVFVLEPLEQEL